MLTSRDRPFFFFFSLELSARSAIMLLREAEAIYNNQLIPIAAEIHAAGANTSKRRIITDAKYTLNAT